MGGGASGGEMPGKGKAGTKSFVGKLGETVLLRGFA